MKKTLILLALMIAVGFCVKNIGFYDNEYTIVTANSVIKLPLMLSNPVTIDNKYRISLVPQISFNEKAITVAPTINENTISGKQDKFTFKTTLDRDGMNVVEEIEIENEFIRTTATVKNTGSTEAPAALFFNINAEQATFFFPSSAEKNANNYIIVTDQSLEGQSIGIISSSPLDTSSEQKPLRNASAYVIGTRTPSLKPGQQLSISLVIYSFDLRKKGTRLYPIATSSHLEEPLLKTSGTYNAEIKSVNTDKIDQMLETLNAEPRKENGSFEKFYTANMNEPKDSLGMSAHFKKLCKVVDVPCRVVAGEKDGSKYAWISAYFGDWTDVDVFQNVKMKPAGYSIIYEEPDKREVTYDPKTPEKSIYSETSFIRGVGTTYFSLYLVLIGIAAIGVLGLLQWKAKIISGVIEKQRGTTITREKINGSYSVLKDTIPDKFLNEVLQNVIEKKGLVNIEGMSEDIKYSKELVSYGVSYLYDSGYIKKTGDIAESTPIMLADKKNKSKLPKNKILLAIAGIALILILVVLFLL